MAKKIFAVIAILLVACVMFGGAFASARTTEEVMHVANAMEDTTVFYDEAASEVVGCEAESENLWMLRNGEYTVLYKDGSYKKLAVSDGSWYFTA